MPAPAQEVSSHTTPQSTCSITFAGKDPAQLRPNLCTTKVNCQPATKKGHADFVRQPTPWITYLSKSCVCHCVTSSLLLAADKLAVRDFDVSSCPSNRFIVTGGIVCPNRFAAILKGIARPCEHLCLKAESIDIPSFRSRIHHASTKCSCDDALQFVWAAQFM